MSSLRSLWLPIGNLYGTPWRSSIRVSISNPSFIIGVGRSSRLDCLYLHWYCNKPKAFILYIQLSNKWYYTISFQDIGSYLYMSVDSFYWKLGLYWRPVAVVLSNVTRTAVLNIFALFCVLVRCTSVVFEILNHRIEILTRAASDDVDHHQQYHLMLHNPPNLFTARLEKWRRNHARACQLVDRINECFGIVLLVTVTNGFVSFITTSFELVRSLQVISYSIIYPANPSSRKVLA